MKIAYRLSLYGVAGLFLALVLVELPHTHGRVTVSPMVAKVDVATMRNESDLIVTGTVTKNLGTVRRSFVTGDMVYTKWLLTPKKYLKGHASQIIVWTMGGQYLSTIIDVEDQPVLSVGQKYTMLLKRIPGEPNAYQIDGSFQGLMTETPTGTLEQYNTKEQIQLTQLQSSQ